MRKVSGDLIELAKSGEFDVIVHGCNCQRVLGAGLALKIARSFPEAFAADKRTRQGTIKLGEISSAVVTFVEPRFKGMHRKTFVVVNAYTQDGFGNGKKHLNEQALASCLLRIDNLYGGLRIGLPLIGCGLAGGDWPIVKRVMHETLGRCIGDNYTVVALPGEEPELPWE